MSKSFKDICDELERIQKINSHKVEDIKKCMYSIPTFYSKFGYVNENVKFIKKLLSHDQCDIEEVPPIVRANSDIYYLLFQNDVRFNYNLGFLIDDILMFTDRKKMNYTIDIYCYTWEFLVQCLISVLQFKYRSVINSEMEEKLKECIKTLKERAESNEL